MPDYHQNLLLHQPKVLFMKGIETELYDDRYE